MEPRYPTEDELERIRKWPCEDFHSLMEFVHELWEFKEFGWTRDGDIYILATGGWSGNEDLIDALQGNLMFWSFYWEQSTRGGKHIFCNLNFENLEKLTEIRT